MFSTIFTKENYFSVFLLDFLYVKAIPKRGLLLTLKAPVRNAADHIHKYFFIVFQRK